MSNPEGIEFLVSCGIERDFAAAALEEYDGDPQTAMNMIFDGEFTLQQSTTPRPSHVASFPEGADEDVSVLRVEEVDDIFGELLDDVPSTPPTPPPRPLALPVSTSFQPSSLSDIPPLGIPGVPGDDLLSVPSFHPSRPRTSPWRGNRPMISPEPLAATSDLSPLTALPVSSPFHSSTSSPHPQQTRYGVLDRAPFPPASSALSFVGSPESSSRPLPVPLTDMSPHRVLFNSSFDAAPSSSSFSATSRPSPTVLFENRKRSRRRHQQQQQTETVEEDVLLDFSRFETLNLDELQSKERVCSRRATALVKQIHDLSSELSRTLNEQSHLREQIAFRMEEDHQQEERKKVERRAKKRAQNRRNQRNGDLDLDNEVEEDDDELALCVVCLDKEKSILLLPCKHLATCRECADQLTDCPLCRAEIEERMEVFVV